MNGKVSREMAIVVKGAAIAVGQCLLGVDGPFLFNRFGLNDAAAAVVGVLVGSAVGYGIAEILLHVGRREPATWHIGHRVATGAPVAHLPL